MILTMKELQKYGSEILNAVSEVCENNNITWFMAYGSLLGAIRHEGPIPWDYDIDIYVPNDDIPRFVEVMKEQLPDKFWVDYRDDSLKKRSFPRIGLKGYDTEILHVDVYRLSGLPNNPLMFKLFASYSRLLFVIWKSRMVDIDNYYPDSKRRIVSKTVKKLTRWISSDWVIDQLDKQAGRIPLRTAAYASCPYETQQLNKRVPKEIFESSMLVEYDNFEVRVPQKYEDYLRIEYGEWRALPPVKERERQLNKQFLIEELDRKLL